MAVERGEQQKLNTDSNDQPMSLADVSDSAHKTDFSILSPPHNLLLTATKKILLPLSSLILFISLFGGAHNLPLVVAYLEKHAGADHLAANGSKNFEQAGLLLANYMDQSRSEWQNFIAINYGRVALIRNWAGYLEGSISDIYDGIVAGTAVSVVNSGHTAVVATRETAQLTVKNAALVHQSYDGSLDDSAAVALDVTRKMMTSVSQTGSAFDQQAGSALTQYQLAEDWLGIKISAAWGGCLDRAKQTALSFGWAAKGIELAYRSGVSAVAQGFDRFTANFYLTGHGLAGNLHRSLAANTAKNINESFTRFSRQSVAAAGQIDNGFILLYEEYVLKWWNRVDDLLYHTGYNALAAWSGFIHGGSKQTVGVSSVSSDMKDQIKQEVMDEIKQQMGGAASQTVLNQVTGGAANQNTGMVVIPQPDSPALSELEKQQIQKAFSDKVVIYLDKSGKTGVIQPVFKNSVGSRYLFVLTPVSNQ